MAASTKEQSVKQVEERLTQERARMDQLESQTAHGKALHEDVEDKV